VVTFRDPVVLPDGDGWRMVVGGGLAPAVGHGPGTACVFGFASDDLVSWRATGLVAARSGAETEPEWTGTKWECPQLVRVDGVDVLVVSVCDEIGLHFVAAAPGTFEGGRFVASAPWQRLTHGIPYAATAFVTREGRPALLTWLRDVGDHEAGWAGALGLPLALGVEQGRVGVDLLVDPRPTSTWEPGPTDFPVRDGGTAVAVVSAEPAEVVVTPAHGGPVLRLPRGHGLVRLVVDGPVLEVVHDGRYGALPLLRLASS
jgi:beta-fructofuranosidase